MKKQSNFSLFINYQMQQNKVPIFLNIILFIILLISLNVNIFDISYNFKAGEVSPLTIITNKTMDYTDSQATDERKKAIINDFIPIFDLDMTVYESKIFVIEELLSVTENSSYDLEEKADQIYSILKPFISQKKMEYIDIKDFIRIDKKRGFLEKLRNTLRVLYQVGIYRPIKGSYDLNQFKEKLIPVRIIGSNNTQREFRRFNNFIYSDISYFEFLKYIGENFGMKRENRTLTDLIYLLLEDNFFVNNYYSEQELNNRLKRIQPVIKTIKEDEVIVRKGEKINQEILDKIKSLKVFDRKNFVRKFVFSFALSLFFIIVLNLMIRIENRKLFYDAKKMTLIFLFIIFNILAIYLYFNILSHLTFPLGILFPITISIYIIAVIMGYRVSFLIAVAISILYAIFLVFYRADNLYSIFYLLLLGIIISLSSKHIHSRDQIIRVSFYCVFPYTLLTAVYIFYFQNYIDADQLNIAFVSSILNPIISGVLSIGLIPVFEKVFNMTTSFRLMEFSNLSNKILNDMHILAPGTYHHSLMVSQLAEAAGREIEADYLLARVGGLYHDIGKLNNPQYFAENMDFEGVENIHEEITPQVSATVLKSHITQGIKIAKELGLPEDVINFIPQHHGTSIMEYFYYKALESQEESDVDLPRFRYAGPKPQTKETAIVMLADATEAAIRALKSKRYDVVEDKINQIFASRISSGELSESPLTLEDIKKIQDIFKKLMFSYYHTRPSYPSDRIISEEDEDD